MSDDLQSDIMDVIEFDRACGVPESEIPKLVANELRRIYTEHGDPGLYLLILRAQELEQL